MSLTCIQSLNNGQPCNAPAVNGSSFCRHHDPQRPHKEVKEEAREMEPLVLPALQDKPSILAALNEVVQALADGRLKRSVAATLVSAIKLASRLVTEINESGQTIPSGMFANDRFQQPGARSGAENARLRSDISRSTQQTLGSQVASREPRKPAQAFSLSDKPTDRFVEEMMAQAHELLAASPRPDPRFLRA